MGNIRISRQDLSKLSKLGKYCVPKNGDMVHDLAYKAKVGWLNAAATIWSALFWFGMTMIASVAIPVPETAPAIWWVFSLIAALAIISLWRVVLAARRFALAMKLHDALIDLAVQTRRASLAPDARIDLPRFEIE